MARRHGKGENPVSVFAFQDVVTAVMGTMLAITMTMALNLTAKVTVKAAEAADAARLEAGAESARPLEELEARRAALEKEYARKKDAANRLAATVPGQDVRKIRALADEVEALGAKARKLESEIKARQAAAQADAADPALKEALAKQLEYEQRAEKLKAEIGGLRLNPRLSYIAPRGIAEKPILIEVRKGKLSFATAQDGGDVNAVSGNSTKETVAQFEEMLADFDPAKVYFYLLIRPSAFGGSDEALHAQVEELLARKGFRYGKDLLDEATPVRPFDAP